MKKILYFVAAIAATTLITTTGTSCKFAPEQQDGDTVAASEFYPEDTSSAHAKRWRKRQLSRLPSWTVPTYFI